MTKQTPREIPRNDLAEMAVAFSCLIDPRQIDIVSEILKPSDFLIGEYRTLFECVCKVHSNGWPADDVCLVMDELRKHDREINNPFTFATDLCQSKNDWITGANAEYYARLVRESSCKRTLLKIAHGLFEKTYDPNESADNITEHLTQEIAENTSSKIDRKTTRQTIEAMKLKVRTEADTATVFTGFDRLDRLTGGFRPGQMIVLGARPSVGKSAFAQQIAERISTAKPILFYSIEMPTAEIDDRRFQQGTSIPAIKFRNYGEMSELEQSIFDRYAESISHSRFVAVYIPTTKIEDIQREARRTKAMNFGELGLVVVDYIGLIQGADDKKSRYEIVTEASRQLKALAGELQVPVLVLSQLNRENSKANKPPQLENLRESGAIEQDADVVLLPHRVLGENETTLYVAKNRQGEVGEIELEWNRDRLIFSEKLPPPPSNYRSEFDDFNDGR